MSRNTDVINISKYLSYILRHKPESIGLALDSEGWADINLMILRSSQNGEKLDREIIQTVVETSEKKRFTISSDGRSIRAAQGHSSNGVSISYPQMVPPKFLYHGTATRFLESIRKQGLIAKSRQFVHLSLDKQTATQVGQRHGKPVILTILADEMHRLGYIFFLSENRVWLTYNIKITFINIPD
ncbi:MAG: RNA 2'-phosphotransferase [Desulfosporosinus sp.]|nr:RNA 2'-phosphotransferase [Desulfosporosinus sp.]